MIETWFRQETTQAVKVQYLDGNVFSQDNNGNKVGVSLYTNGESTSVSGSISANIIRSDGATVTVSGSSSGNRAWVILPQSAYAVPGVISIIIKATSSGNVTTLCAVVANVYQSSTDAAVDPGTIIPSVQNLIDDIAAAVATIPVDYSDLQAAVAPAFDSGLGYTQGDIVTYDGDVYQFNVDHLGSWAAADVDAASVGANAGAALHAVNGKTMNYAILHFDGYDAYQLAEPIPPGTPVTIECNISSTETDESRTSMVRCTASVYSQLISTSQQITRDEDHTIMFTTLYPVTKIYFLASNNTSNSSGKTLTVNHFAVRYGHSVQPTSGFDVSEGIAYMLTNYSACKLEKPGVYTVKKPISMAAGSLLSGNGDNCILRLAASLPSVSVTKSDDTGTSYVAYSSTGSGDLAIPELAPGFYKFTINVSIAQPIPTADTSTIKIGSSTSYSSDIASISIDRDTDVNGYFYASETVKSIYVLAGIGTSSGVDITVNSLSIQRIGAVVALGAKCGIQNLCVSGADGDIDTSTPHTMTLGTRNGIVWYGEKEGSYISKCRIENFDGSGIICTSSGTPPHQAPRISDCYVVNNGCGLNIATRSEYLKVCNNMFCYNGYGVINRGGNNAFANCGFDRNKQGMQIDAVDSGNAGHGQIVGCTFNHSDNNSGYGLIISGTGRMLIGNCNFYYSKILLQSTNGHTFTGCGFGSSSGIEISGGTCSIFSGCMLMNASEDPITITDNTTVKFVGCYYRSGAEVVPA